MRGEQQDQQDQHEDGASLCAWLQRVVPLMHCLCAYRETLVDGLSSGATPSSHAPASPENPPPPSVNSLPSLMESLLQALLDVLRVGPVPLVVAPGSAWVWVQPLLYKLFQESIFLVSYLQEAHSSFTSTTLSDRDFLSHDDDDDDVVLPSEKKGNLHSLLAGILQQGLVRNDAPLHVLLFQLVRTLQPCTVAFWRVLGPSQPLLRPLYPSGDEDSQGPGALWPAWKRDLVGRLGVVTLCEVLFHTQSGPTWAQLLEEVFAQPLVVGSLLHHTRERQVQNLMRILPPSQVSQLMHHLQSHLPPAPLPTPRPLLPVAYLLVLLLIPCGALPLVVTMVGLVAQYTQCYLLAFSSRKLVRHLMRHVLALLQEHQEVQLARPTLDGESWARLHRHMHTLQASPVYRQGSDHVQVVRDIMALIEPHLMSPSEEEEEEEERRRGGCVASVEYGPKALVEAYRQGTLRSLVGLATLSRSTLLELIQHDCVALEDVERLVLDPHTLLSTSTPTSPHPLLSSPSSPGEDLLQFTLDANNNNNPSHNVPPPPPSLAQVVLEYYQRRVMMKPLPHHSSSSSPSSSSPSFHEMTKVSSSLMFLSQCQPEFVEQVVQVCTLPTVLAHAQQAMTLYLTHAHYRTRRSPSSSLHSVLLWAAWALSVVDPPTRHAWWDDQSEGDTRGTGRYQEWVMSLWQLYQVAMQESEPILPSWGEMDGAMRRELPVVDWETTRVEDVLGDLVVALLTPSLSTHCRRVTPRDTRPATRFQFCHGTECLHGFVDLLTTLLRLFHPTAIYPTVTEEAGDFFIDTPLRALGMTCSDQELLQQGVQTLPAVFVGDESQLQSVFGLLQRILQSALAPEPLQATACQGLSLLVLSVEYVYREQQDQPARRPPTPSKAEFFLSSGQGVKLLQLQALLEPLQLWAQHLGHPRDATLPLAHAHSVQAHHASFLNAPWESRVDQVAVPRQRAVGEAFLLQRRYGWVNEQALSRLAATTADLLLSLAASVQEERSLMFLRQQCLRALLHVCHLLSLDQLQAIVQLATTMMEQDAPGDTAGVQLALMAMARAVALCKHSRLSPSLLAAPLATLPGRIRRCLESSHAASHVAGLHTIRILMKHQVYEAVSPLLPFLLPYALRVLRDKGGPPEKDIRAGHEVQGVLMEVVFALLERFTREAEQNHFTRPALEAMMQALEEPSSPALVGTIFRGLHTLLVSFSLSHAQRTMVRSCALQYLPSSLFLPALSLMLTCMYTGDQNDAPPTAPDDSEQVVQMDNVERAKILFHKLHHGLAGEAQGVARILPPLLCDFFAMDQVLSLVLGEFVRTKQAQRPQLIARVLFDVIQQYQVEQPAQMNVVLKWICLCLKNFIQMEPLTYSKWAITCLFMTVSPSPALLALYEQVADAYPHAPLQDTLFLHTALDFYRHPHLSTRRRESFLIIFDTPHPVYQQLVTLCRHVPPEQTPHLPDP